MFVCVSLREYVLKEKVVRSSQMKDKWMTLLSMRHWLGAGRPKAVSCAEDHTGFSPASPILRHPQFCQWISRFKAALHLDLVPSAKLQPQIFLKLQIFQQPFYSSKSNIQTSMGPTEFSQLSGFLGKVFVQLMRLIVPPVGMIEKKNLHSDVKRPKKKPKNPHQNQRTEMIK